jgi:uncharacterized membrane protein
MTWLQRYRFNKFMRTSVWLPPFFGMLAAMLMLPPIRWLDAALGWQAAIGPDGARAMLGALVASLLTFIVFVFTILLVAVQLASAQLTPRIIAAFYRNRVLKSSLTIFVFAFTFTLAALSRIEDPVPQIMLSVAMYSSIVSIGVFLYLIDHLSKSMRPVIVLTGIGNLGQKVIETVYPRLVVGTQDAPAGSGRPLAGRELTRTMATNRTGVVLAFDAAGLVNLARRADCLIELVPQVGDLVTRGAALFRLHGGGAAITDDQLEHAVAIGPERTMEQDPEFAFRIIVDIAAKALSPAINDPTTGVLAFDQIHRLLGVIGARELGTGRVRDGAGKLRLVYRTPDWDDYVSLAVVEIRQFGKDSIQIVRRMRAMLEALIETVPPQRAAPLRAELAILARGVERDFPDLEDRARAATGDSLGVGGSP